MTESGESAPFNGRRVLKRVESQPTIGQLCTKVRALHEEMQTLLDELVEADRKQCGGSIPPAVIRGWRLSLYCHRPCLCAWVKDEYERGGGES
jgi:hypothetical protein